MNLDRKDLAELGDFIKRNYRPDYVLLNQDFFNYFFKNYLSSDYSFKVIKIKNKIKAMLGLMPYKMKYFDKTVKAVFLLNLMVDKDLRGAGLGPKLVVEAQEECDICYTLSYEKEMEPIYQKLGWTKIPDLKRFVKIFNFERTNKLALNKLDKENINNSLQIDRSFVFEKIAKFESEINQFWQRVKERYPITIERTADYLNWRYARHPLLKYHIFLLKKKGIIESFIVLRIEKGPGFEAGRIIDFICSDQSQEQALLNLLEYCKGLDFIDFFKAGDFYSKSLEKTGFVKADSSLPMLLNPVDRSKKSINFIFKGKEKTQDINAWYVTKGDGDQDRPN